MGVASEPRQLRFQEYLRLGAFNYMSDVTAKPAPKPDIDPMAAKGMVVLNRLSPSLDFAASRIKETPISPPVHRNNLDQSALA